jgi:hypothetical protein
LDTLCNVDDACRLNFDDAIGYQFDKSGHKNFHRLCRFQKFDPNGKVLTTHTWRTVRVNTVMNSKSRMATKHRRSRDPLRKEEGNYLQVKVVSFRSCVFIQVNYDPLSGSSRKHAAILCAKVISRR